MRLKALLEGKTVFRNLAAKRQTDNEMDDTTIDNDSSAFNDVICFIPLVFNNMQTAPKK